MVEVDTSVLDIDEDKIIKTIYDLEVAKTNYFHIDVMDGKFVENDTSEKMRKYTEYIKSVSNIPINVHLMVEDIENYIKSYLALNVNTIIFHIESCKNKKAISEYISLIKQNNTKVGLSIKPNTPIEEVYEFLPYIHEVLVMAVEPGRGGQRFIELTLEKIQRLNIFAYENGYDIDISVDGGINGENAKKVIDAGANLLVSGSYIINSNNYSEAIKSLR